MRRILAVRRRRNLPEDVGDVVGDRLEARLLLDEPLDALLEGARDGLGGVLVHSTELTIMYNYARWC